MALWATKRRLAYGGALLLILAILFLVFFVKLFYHQPTCSDGVQNGNETGVDCGGSCQLICTSDALKPVVLWAKTFNISGDVYSAVAYVQNPNINSVNAKATYKFRILDENNSLIMDREGETSIPKNQKFAVFEVGLVIKNVKPKLTQFTFTSFAPWTKDAQKPVPLTIRHSTLLATSTIPRIDGTIINDSLTQSATSLELDAFVLDSKENVVAASRTFINDLSPKTSQGFVFTWPKPFDLGVEECLTPVDVVLAVDKSSSMKSEQVSPPEPFTTVTKTAEDFLQNLGDSDQVSVVSFGTNAKKEDTLTSDKVKVTQDLENLSLSTTTLEQTNIAEGLQFALENLTTSPARSDSKKIAILLTDGVPTEPKQAGQPDYPKISAQHAADMIKSQNIELYLIGLGKGVNENFLRSLATDDGHYFHAPTKETLHVVYNNIDSTLCEKKPNIINIVSRPL